MKNYYERVRSTRIYEVVREAPIDSMAMLSLRIGNEVLLKREDLQTVFSFKLRGAFNKLCQLSEIQRRSGVVAASAGNHAQGVAMAARSLGVEATIVMPETTPQIKLDAVRFWGVNVVLHGDTFDEAFSFAKKLRSF